MGQLIRMINRWQDQGVMTPIHEDDVPKLAEISRTLSDFRAEFREAVSKMVRSDVYLADLRTIEVRLTSLGQENERNNKQAEVRISGVEARLAEERGDRRTLRNMMLGSIITGLISIIIAISSALLK
jgi:hypothetical protein